MPEFTRRSRAHATPPRYQMFLDGRITVDDLDDEEIMRGQIRNANGNFQGRPPLLVPQSFTQALMQRQRDLIKREMAPMVLTALHTLNEVMQQREIAKEGQTNLRGRVQAGINDGPRVAAAKLVLERVLGKVPEQIEMNATVKQWEDVLEGVLVETDTPDTTKEIEQ